MPCSVKCQQKTDTLTLLGALRSGAMYAHVSSRAACERVPSPAPCVHLLLVPGGHAKKRISAGDTPRPRAVGASGGLLAACACAAKRREAPGSSRAEITGVMLRKRDLVHDASPLPPTPASLYLTPLASTCAASVNSQPYTLHPTPYTLHPKPYTLNPKPYTPKPRRHR